MKHFPKILLYPLFLRQLYSKDHIEFKSFRVQMNLLINGILSLWACIIPHKYWKERFFVLFNTVNTAWTIRRRKTIATLRTQLELKKLLLSNSASPEISPRFSFWLCRRILVYGLNFGRRVVFTRQKILGETRGKFPSPRLLINVARWHQYGSSAYAMHCRCFERTCEICLAQSRSNMFSDERFCRLAILFDAVWSRVVKFEMHETSDQKASNIAIVLVFDVRCLVRLTGFTKHVWRAHEYYYHADFGHTHPRWLLAACVMACLQHVWPRHHSNTGKVWSPNIIREVFLFLSLSLVITHGYPLLFKDASHSYNYKFVFRRL